MNGDQVLIERPLAFIYTVHPEKQEVEVLEVWRW